MPTNTSYTSSRCGAPGGASVVSLRAIIIPCSAHCWPAQTAPATRRLTTGRPGNSSGAPPPVIVAADALAPPRRVRRGG